MTVVTSADRAYWWDGVSIRWLDASDRTGVAAELLTGPDQRVGFAVSSDDRRIVITEITYSAWPLHRTTWVEDLGTHANRTALFDGSVTGQVLPTGWPIGWHQGFPVLFDSVVCTQGGGPGLADKYDFRLVDPKSGSRVVDFGVCRGGDVAVGGVLCPAGDGSLQSLDWAGVSRATFSQPNPGGYCAMSLSQNAAMVLAECLTNGPGQDQFLPGSGRSLPSAIAHATELVWMDDDHLLVSDLSAPGQFSIWSVSEQRLVSGPMALPAPTEWYQGAKVPALPGGY